MPTRNSRVIATTARGTIQTQAINDGTTQVDQRGKRQTTKTSPEKVTSVAVPDKITTSDEPEKVRVVNEGARTTTTVKGETTESANTTTASAGTQTTNEHVGATIRFKIVIRGGLQGAGTAPPIT